MLLKEDELRRKIIRWLKSLKNSTYPISTLTTTSSVKMIMNLTAGTTGEYYDKNETSITNTLEQLNLSPEELEAFIKKHVSYTITKAHTACYAERSLQNGSDYCQGDIKNFLTEYNFYYHGYVTLLICIFGTIANILNIIVLTRKDMSKTPINKILKWLAVADMFVMIEYIPYTSYMHIVSPERNGQYIWAVYLLCHMHFTQILHTISISLTVTLAIWRYVAIKHPHGKFSTFLFSHCSQVILFSFIISPILCFPTFFVFNIKHKESDLDIYSFKHDDPDLYCVDAQEETALFSFNFWVHSILIKLLPCCILTVISFILVKVLCDASKRRMKLKEYNQPTKNSDSNGTNRKPSSKFDRRPDRTTMLLLAVLFLFLITEFPQGILGLLSGILGKKFLVGCYIRFGEVMDLLALFNAAVGFVLYGLMSKQFRTSFKSLFFETRLSRLEMTRITGINNTTCV